MTRTKFAILAVIAFLLLMLLTYYIVTSMGGNQPLKPVTLKFWGPYDKEEVYGKIFDNYHRLHPNVSFEYQQIPFDQYEQKLVLALANDSGPDIWMMHNTWLPNHKQYIYPLPQGKQADTGKPIFTYDDFVNTDHGFVDVTALDLTSNREIFGLPLYVDTLALYYNTQMFNEALITHPPKTYQELNADVQLLTKRDGSNTITQSGIALGTANNINRASDILMMLMMQSGTLMNNADGNEATFAQPVNDLNVGRDALTYYTQFANPALISSDRTKYRYTWDVSLPYSIDAFARSVPGVATAMMFNYAYQLKSVQERNPNLSFRVAEVPRPDGAPTIDKIAFANYWAPTVSKKSANPVEAWKFITYLATSSDAITYLNNTELPAARRDIIELQKNDSVMGVFANQALVARSWRQPNNTKVEAIFLDMISSINKGTATEREAIQSAENLVNVEYQKLEQ